jgi:hypothetical protein
LAWCLSGPTYQRPSHSINQLNRLIGALTTQDMLESLNRFDPPGSHPLQKHHLTQKLDKYLGKTTTSGTLTALWKLFCGVPWKLLSSMSTARFSYKTHLHPLLVVHPPTSGEKHQTPGAHHPCLQTHPEEGRELVDELLRHSPLMTSSVLSLPPALHATKLNLIWH